MVEKIIRYKVGDVTYDNEEDAIRAEASHKLQGIIKEIEFAKSDVTPILAILGLLAADKALWEAMVNYCGALKPFHIPRPDLDPRASWLRDPHIQPTYTEEEAAAFTILPTRELDQGDD